MLYLVMHMQMKLTFADCVFDMLTFITVVSRMKVV